MAFNEEIMARIGVDTSTLAQGLRSAQNQFDRFGDKVKSQFADIGRKIVAIFAIERAVTFGQHLGRLADDITTAADNLGVTNKFIQGFADAAEKSGVAAETAQKGLEKFVQIIGEARQEGSAAEKAFTRLGISLTNADGTAKGTQSLLSEVSDKLNGIKDAGDRAAVAVDLFGKSGVQMSAFLAQGSASIDQLVNSANVLSDESLENIVRARRAIQELKQEVEVFFGNTIVSRLTTVGRFATSFAERFKQVLKGELAFIGFGNLVVSDVAKVESEQAARLAARKPGAGTAAGKSADEIDRERRRNLEEAIRARKIEEAALQRKLDMEKRILELQRLQAQAANALASARADRAKFTVAELADSPFRFTGRLAAEQMQARQVQALERFAEVNRLRGFNDLALSQFNRAEELRKGLTNVVDRERFPFRTLEQNSEKQTGALLELASKASNEGLKILPVNAE